MLYYRCECGEAEAWTSGMSIFDCHGCSKCGTTLAISPERHKPLIPHDFSKKLFDQHTGKPYFVCSRCGELEMESFKEAQKPDEKRRK